MNIHPSLLKLSKRLNVWLPAPGLLAAAVYLATLSRSVCPGDSASLTAAAAGLATPSGAASPLFAWAARLAAGCPLATLPVRLNLFSALCGAACATLLFSLLSRLVFFFSCETQSGADRVPGSDLAPLTELSPEALAQNRRLLRLAAAAGCVASFFFTFGPPRGPRRHVSTPAFFTSCSCWPRFTCC